MKNLNKSYIKNIIYSFLIMIVFVTQSCDTEIPPTDTDLPKFSLKITGDGFDHTFTEEDNFDSFQLNLRDDQEYDFIYSASDQGGLKLMQMQYSLNNIEFETAIPSNWEQTNNGFSGFLTWRGDANNAITGTILTGTFRVNGDLVAFGILFEMRDYGGQSGSSNILFKDLNVFSGNHATEIIPF